MLRWDAKEIALKGSEHGPVIVPGKSAQSVMIHLVAGLKGDDNIMNTTLQMVMTPGMQPDVTLTLGTNLDGLPAAIVVPPSIYMVEIQAGPQAGQVLPQFNPLGLTGLVLVGSVLMDQLYTILHYSVTETEHGYHLAPVGMWIFNKKGGPKLIKSTSGTPFALQRRAPHKQGQKGQMR